MSKMQNILFLMADQFVWSGIGKIGGWIDTPNLDMLLADSTWFNRCYTTSPLCMPARSSMAVCRYPRELNIEDNETKGMDASCHTWMKNIQQIGYETSLFGKLHMHNWAKDLRDNVETVHAYGYEIVDEIPGPRTYGKFKSNYYDLLEQKNLLQIYNDDVNERYRNKVYTARPSPLPLEYYPDRYVGNRAVEYLEQYSKAKPWFCTVSFGGPHEPWDAPEEYLQRYSNRQMPPPLPKPTDHNPNRPHGVFDEILNGSYDFALNSSVLSMTSEDVAEIRKSYAGKVSLIDDEIGRILTVVKQRGEWDNTIIVFTSDHGEQNGDYGLIFKQTFFESSAKIPLLIKPNKGFGGITGKNDALTDLVDLGPTLLELVNAQQLTPCDGKSLCPVLSGSSECHKEFVVSQLYGETMLRNEQYKAVFNRDGRVYLLFDLQKDPQEQANLAGLSEMLELEQKMTCVLAGIK